MSGPLLDRIDLCVEMDPIAFDELHTAAPSESSAELRKQVLAARAIQAKRYAAPGFKGVHCNAQLNAGQVRRICRMTPGAEQLLRSSYDALGLSARAHDRILRVARTVADLAGKPLHVIVPHKHLYSALITWVYTKNKRACSLPRYLSVMDNVAVKQIQYLV